MREIKFANKATPRLLKVSHIDKFLFPLNIIKSFKDTVGIKKNIDHLGIQF